MSTPRRKSAKPAQSSKASPAAACPMTQPVFGNLKCVPCEGGTPPMTQKAIREGLKQLPGWKYQHGAIRKTYHFKNYHETMDFVNASAAISHKEDHHPDLGVFYNKCEVAYYTHAIHGISQNDFICAAKVEKILGR